MAKYLKKLNPDEIAERKYNRLLIGMVVLLIVSPLYMMTGLKFPLVGFLFFTIVQLALKATIDEKKRLLIYRLIVLVALICVLASQRCNAPFCDALYVISRCIYIVFLLITIKLFMGRIAAAERVTTDKVKGGICLYLLAGVVWSFLYEVIYRFDASAFQIQDADGLDFLYYSYSTLTSLGIGDISSTNDFAISLTCLEAISGQMFIAVFIARLIGLHIIHKHKSVKTEKE
jgi:hypothetical protein